MRTRRKKSEMPFADALDAATKRLKHAQKERDAAVRQLASLDSEIPALQRTIIALNNQLKGPAQYVNTSEVASYPTYGSVIEQVERRMAEAEKRLFNPPSDIPPEVLAQLPPDYLQPTPEVSDDSLPPIDGVPVIPEK